MEALLAIYMNREVNIELLDESLQMPGKRRDNIIMRNLFVLLASPEMAAQPRFLCIVYFAICIPMRWLAGKTHALKDFPVGDTTEEKWCTWSMGRVLETLHEQLGEIIAFPSLFLSEKYMMNFFSKYANELPPFKEYLKIMFNNRMMMIKNRTTGMQVAHLAMAKRELFNPKKKTNTKSTARMLDIVSVGIPQTKKDLIDTRKATWRNL